MKYPELRESVYEANRKLGESGLVVLTWGNVSGLDREGAFIAIKPSGVSYDDLKVEDIVVLELETGKQVYGSLRPSSDTLTHLELYRAFKGIHGIVHTHSPYATAWAQVKAGIPVYGTTHADTFNGTIPVTRFLTEEEVKRGYEKESGKVIVEHFRRHALKPTEMPAILLPCHGPFTWGKNPDKAVENAVILEEVAKIAGYMRAMQTSPEILPNYMLAKHFKRKHGPAAYYGQQSN